MGTKEHDDIIDEIRAALLQRAEQIMEDETIPENLKDLFAAYADALTKEEPLKGEN